MHVELFGGHSQITAQAAIVGCQSDLDALTGEHLETIRDTIKALLNERGLKVGFEREERRFRVQTARRINEALGRDVVSDVFVYRFSFSEDLGD